MQLPITLASITKCTPLRCVQRQINTQYVPKHEPAQAGDIHKLENFLLDKPNTLVLTGAGISTESGRF